MKLSMNSKTWIRRMDTGVFFYRGAVEFKSYSKEELDAVLRALSRAFKTYGIEMNRTIPSPYLELHHDIYNHIHRDGDSKHLGHVMDELRQCVSECEIQAVKLKYPFVVNHQLVWNRTVREVVASIAESMLMRVEF